jgi:hypothetical protein
MVWFIIKYTSQNILQKIGSKRAIDVVTDSFPLLLLKLILFTGSKKFFPSSAAQEEAEKESIKFLQETKFWSEVSIRCTQT